jgi:hypothetical protein
MTNNRTPNQQYHRQCKGKKRFDSAIGAQFRMAQLQEQRVEGFERLEVYHCQHCNGWHVGHRPKPVKEPELLPDFRTPPAFCTPEEAALWRADRVLELPHPVI